MRVGFRGKRFLCTSCSGCQTGFSNETQPSTHIPTTYPSDHLDQTLIEYLNMSTGCCCADVCGTLFGKLIAYTCVYPCAEYVSAVNSAKAESTDSTDKQYSQAPNKMRMKPVSGEEREEPGIAPEASSDGLSLPPESLVACSLGESRNASSGPDAPSTVRSTLASGSST